MCICHHCPCNATVDSWSTHGQACKVVVTLCIKWFHFKSSVVGRYIIYQKTFLVAIDPVDSCLFHGKTGNFQAEMSLLFTLWWNLLLLKCFSLHVAQLKWQPAKHVQTCLSSSYTLQMYVITLRTQSMHWLHSSCQIWAPTQQPFIYLSAFVDLTSVLYSALTLAVEYSFLDCPLLFQTSDRSWYVFHSVFSSQANITDHLFVSSIGNNTHL